jgi:outer membrane protein assembly factor BamB
MSTHEHGPVTAREEQDGTPRRLDRRRFVGVGAGLAGVALTGATLHAQEGGTPAPEGEEFTGPKSATPEALGPARPPEFDDPANWPSENGDLQSTRVMRESTISTETVGQLGLAWSLPIDTSSGFGALVGPPVIVGDVVYQQDALSNVLAINKESGEVLWEKTYDQPVTSGGPNGVAVAYGRVYYSVGLGTITCIDAATGHDIWQNDKVIGPLNEGVCMAPLVYDNVVYVSTVPGNVEGGMYQPGQRGVFYALDAQDGTVLWYWETVNDNLWGNPRVNSGGGLWHSPTVDEQGNIYLAIANAAPFPGTEEYPNTSSRPGENPYTNYLVSLDIETGGMNWGYSMTGHDPFDQDNHLSPISTNLTINGVDTHVILATGKHGYVVCANAETGDQIWRTATGVHQNNEVDDIPAGEKLEVYPGSQGGNQTPIAYSDGLLFIAMNVAPSYFDQTSYESAIPIIGEATGKMAALDATTGEVVWEVDTPTAMYGAASVVNDVVFGAGLDGVVRGYNTANGEQVFSYQARAGINAPLSLSGDYLFVPAGTALFPSEDTASPAPELTPSLTALKIGGEVQATPEAGAATAEASSEATPATAGESGALLVTAVDIGFDPTELSIAADTGVTITVVNKGVLQHDLVIEGTDFKTPLLNGGESAELEVNLPAGTYTYFCSVPGHREAGMEGTLTVG